MRFRKNTASCTAASGMDKLSGMNNVFNSFFERSQFALQELPHFSDIRLAPGHVTLFKLGKMNNLRAAFCNSYYQLSKLKHADFIVVANVHNIVNKKIVVKQVKHGFAMVINITEGARLAAITVNGNVFMLQRSGQKLRDNKVNTLSWSVGIEETENGIAQSILFIVGAQVGFPHILYDSIW